MGSKNRRKCTAPLPDQLEGEASRFPGARLDVASHPGGVGFVLDRLVQGFEPGGRWRARGVIGQWGEFGVQEHQAAVDHSKVRWDSWVGSWF